MALVGVGMVSSVYVDAFAKLAAKFRLVGALGASSGTTERFCQAACNPLGYPINRYALIDEIARDSKVDFVIVATPPNARFNIVETLSAARKPILMEKPVERTLSAARQLCELCETRSVPFGIVLQHRARPSALALRKALKQQDFGSLNLVEISVPWWRDQAYYDEPGRGTFERDGGGVLINQAIHTMDLALQFTGPIKSVSALMTTSRFHSMESEDFVSAGLHFANGAVGNLIATTSAFPGRAEHIVLHYDRVSARLESSELTLSWHDGRHETIGANVSTGAGADPMAFSSDWHQSIIQNFADVLSGITAPIASGYSALAVHQLIEALQHSAKQGQEVFLEPITHEE